MNNTNEPTASPTNNPAASSDRPTTPTPEWISNPFIHIRENTPTKKASQKSQVYQVVKRLRDSHPACSPDATHICTIEGCQQPLLKLQKRVDSNAWHSGKASEHVKIYHHDSADPRLAGLKVIKGIQKRQVCNHKYFIFKYIIIS